jgi:hypothetical protein
MADDDRPIELGRLDQPDEIDREGREVVSVLRFVGQPVAAEVRCEDGVAGGRKPDCDRLPDPGSRR